MTSPTYMQQYIELSKEFKLSDKSPESIQKLYTLLETLKKADTDKQAKQVLSYVYTLLGYHKSAYKVFEQIADKNNRKDTGRLFSMKELAQSHGDNFAVKLPGKTSIQKQPILATAHFCIMNSETDNWLEYECTKQVQIFGKLFDEEPLELSLWKELKIEDCLPAVNSYLAWLGNDAKSTLQEFYNNEFEDEANDKWYDSLEIYNVQISVNKIGDTFAAITCGDNLWSDHLLDIELKGKEIESMNYDG